MRKAEIQVNYPHYYKNFSCIGGACPATCCAGWNISIDDRSLNVYKKAGGAFGSRLRSAVDFQHARFKSESGRCPLLDGQGLCDIYNHLGKAHMCRTCRTYPRHMEDYGNVHEVMLSLSCPQAARLILLDSRPFSLHSGVKVYRLSNRQARQAGPVPGMAHVFWVRSRLFHMLYDEKYLLPVRLKRMLRSFSGEGHWLEEWLSPNAFNQACLSRRLAMLFSLTPVCNGWEEFLEQSVDILNASSNTPEAQSSFLKGCAKQDYLFVNVAAHYLYMYFAGAVYDRDMAGKVRLMVFHVCTLSALSYARWLMGRPLEEALVDSAWIYSRQVDHEDVNLQALEMILKQ